MSHIDLLQKGILDAHGEILERLKKKNIEEIKAGIEKINDLKIFGESPLQSDRDNALKKIAELRKNLINAENQTELISYLTLIEPVIEKYKERKTASGPTYFGLKKTDQNSCSDIMEEFFYVAKKFFPIKYRPQSKNENTCAQCSTLMYEEEGFLVCKECGMESPITCDENSMYYKDINRINITPKSAYSSKQNFDFAISKLQGIFPMPMSESVISYIREKLDDEGYKNVTKRKIYDILKQKKMSQYYGLVPKIFSIITGIPCHFIVNYKSQIDELYEIIKKVYFDMSGRENSLNVWFKLYKILKLLQYPCTKDDLCFSISEKSMEDYEDLWKKIVKNIPPEVKKSISYVSDWNC